MKDDFISRQAAINAIENTECELLAEEWDELTDAIKHVPSAEPEIIRCKGCKYWTNNIGDSKLRDNYCNE